MAQILGGLARGDAEVAGGRGEGAEAGDGEQQPHQIEGVEFVVIHGIPHCVLLGMSVFLFGLIMSLRAWIIVASTRHRCQEKDHDPDVE
ncbi:hypothetical protein D3C85_1203200 [compost metagenome]